MNGNCDFNQDPIVELCAAMVGVHKSIWDDVPDGVSEAQASEIMLSKKYDILPIRQADKTVGEFFHTQAWNDYSVIKRGRISVDETISFDTPIKEVIKGLADGSKHFFFLERDQSIEGLITIADLNSREIKTYLYSLMSDLEINLGRLISQRCTEEEIESALNADGKRVYETAKENGVDVAAIEYLYLPQFLKLTGKKELWRELDYLSKKKFCRAFNPLVDLRNAIAHPTRSILTRPEDCKGLKNKIAVIEHALSILHARIDAD